MVKAFTLDVWTTIGQSAPAVLAIAGAYLRQRASARTRHDVVRGELERLEEELRELRDVVDRWTHLP